MKKVPFDLDEFKNLKKPPKELFYEGNLELLKHKKVAIVGTRKPSNYTRELTYTIANRLSQRGVVIVSGGAIGVDSIAHLASLPNTIAIFANSLDLIYPKTNRNLIEQIYTQGLALSEEEKNFTPYNWSFVHRNRLIIALSDMVIIPEADIDSGSMQSAKIAIELKKEIVTIPHRLYESLGTQNLLQKSLAKQIYDISEFVESFGICNIYSDEILEFCKNSPTLDEAIAKFGDKIYEYELDGKIEIVNLKIRVT